MSRGVAASRLLDLPVTPADHFVELCFGTTVTVICDGYRREW
jgi:hypothetical protein